MHGHKQSGSDAEKIAIAVAHSVVCALHCVMLSAASVDSKK